MIKKYDYETCEQNRTFNNYEDVHCFLSADLHDYIKFLKFGYSKVHDHASREIRLKRITRSEGIKLVRKYQNKKPKNIKIFSEWIGLSKKIILEKLEKIRNKKIWYKDKKNKKWKLRFLLKSEIDNKYQLKSKNSKSYKNFKINLRHSWDKEDTFLLMGRGYIDKFNYGSIKDKK